MASAGPPPVNCSTPESLAESQAAHKASLIIIVVAPALSTLFVALRIWSRRLMRTFGWDDALIVAALALAIAMAGVAWRFAKVSYTGYHVCDVPPFDIPRVVLLNKWLLAQQLVYNPILALVKASVLIFLLRFQDTRWFIHRTLQVFFVLNIALGIAIFLADLFQCTPVRYMFDFINMDIQAALQAGANPMTGMKPDGTVVKGGTCINKTAFVLWTAGIVTFTEALTLLIPMAMIWNLQIARRKKIAVIVILSLGWIVVATSIARIIIFSRLLSSTPGDASYGAQNQMSSIEINLAIIVACAPALRALTSTLLPRFFSSHQRSTGAYYYDNGSRKRTGGSGTAGTNLRRSRVLSTPGTPGTGGKDMYDIGTIDDSSVERTESQEQIIRPGVRRHNMGIEKTVQIDIEMVDLKDVEADDRERKRRVGEVERMMPDLDGRRRRREGSVEWHIG